MPKPTPEELHRITERGVAEIIVKSEFVRLLEEGKPLRLKMGFDPSRPDLHLGHVVGLRKLRQLQDLGHQVVLIVGDWTARIGDPSGQSDTRTMLSAEEVRSNAETYMHQFFKVIDRERIQAVYQSEWFGDFSLAQVIELTARFTVNQFLHRLSRAHQRSLLIGGQIDLDHLLDATRAKLYRDARVQPLDSVLSLEIRRARQDLLTVQQNRLNHLSRRRRRRVVRRAGLQQPHDLCSTVTGALHDLLES